MPLEHLSTALADAIAHPLSAKRMMLCALLIDAEVDRLAGDGDLLAFRAALGAKSAALQLVMELCALREGGPRLGVETVEVPLADYPKLSEADFMVSLYNNRTVQRVRIAMSDGARHDALEVLRVAVEGLGPRT